MVADLQGLVTEIDVNPVLAGAEGPWPWMRWLSLDSPRVSRRQQHGGVGRPADPDRRAGIELPEALVAPGGFARHGQRLLHGPSTST